MDKETKKAFRTASSKVEAPELVAWETIRNGLTFPLRRVIQEDLLTEFPEDLTRVTTRRLGELNSKYTAYLVFINEKMAESKFDLRRKRLELSNARSRLVFITRGPFKAKVFAAVNCNEKVQRLREDQLGLSAVLSVWNSILWSVKGFINAIEFEVERRRAIQYAEGGGHSGKTQAMRSQPAARS